MQMTVLLHSRTNMCLWKILEVKNMDKIILKILTNWKRGMITWNEAIKCVQDVYPDVCNQEAEDILDCELARI